MDGTFEFAVIGAGIAGASAAWRLAPHASVVLLERESQPGYHTTGRSAALFMESYGPPQVQALTLASRAFLQNPPAEFGAQPILTPRGMLYVATREQGALLEQAYAELTQGSTDVGRIGKDELIAMVPVLRPDVIDAGMLETGAADIDVHALHQGFLRGLRQRGGMLATDAHVVGLTRDEGGWRIDLGNDEVVRARHIVNAAGAWADVLAQLAGVRPVGLEPRRRSAFTFAPPTGIVVAHWPAVVGIDESFYFKPDAGRLLGSPANADPTTPHDVKPEEVEIATGIHHIERVTTMTIRRPSHTWAGLRSFVPDDELVIGWDDERSVNPASDGGFFWLAGQGGYGIQSAAAASQLGADLLLARPLSDELRAHGVNPATMRPQRLH